MPDSPEFPVIDDVVGASKLAAMINEDFFDDGSGDPSRPLEPRHPMFSFEEIERMLEKAESDPSWRIPEADTVKLLRSAKEFYCSGY